MSNPRVVEVAKSIPSTAVSRAPTPLPAADLACRHLLPPRCVLRIAQALFALVAGVYTGTRHAAHMARGQDDATNTAIGGVAAGALLGFYRRTLSGGIAAALFLAAVAPLVESACVRAGSRWARIPPSRTRRPPSPLPAPARREREMYSQRDQTTLKQIYSFRPRPVLVDREEASE